MQIEEVLTDKSGRELTKHAEQNFPLAFYKNDMYKFLSRSVPWHWHNECEISVVEKGSMILEYGGSRVVLNEGESYFVNRNYLHAQKASGELPCSFNSILFDATFVSGAPYSLIHEKYVLPVINRKEVPPLIFTNNRQTAGEISGYIREFESVWDKDITIRELKLREILVKIWERIYICFEDMPKRAAYRYEPYLKAVLCYISENYASRLTLKDIAYAAGISVSTLNRCFREGIGLSVNDYVTDYRVRMAAQNMTENNMTVTEACYASGFNEPSYFAKVFKAVTGMKPFEYKQNGTKIEITSTQ